MIKGIFSREILRVLITTVMQRDDVSLRSVDIFIIKSLLNLRLAQLMERQHIGADI